MDNNKENIDEFMEAYDKASAYTDDFKYIVTYRLPLEEWASELQALIFLSEDLDEEKNE